jgi:hypothetical protein
MNYFIKRDLQEFGPYSLADLQRYVGTGSILITDLARSEGMTDWMPVSSVIGTIPVPVAAAPHGYEPMAVEYPMPPSLHWAAVLALSIVTCFLFAWAWFFIQAVFVKKLVSKNLAMVWAGIALAVLFGAGFAQGAAHGSAGGQFALLKLVGAGFWIAANFSLKNALEEHYNSEENIGLSLSGVMVFFFNVIYIQYHLNKITEAKKQSAAAMHA